MARRPFAGTPGDYVINANGTPLPGRDESNNVVVSGQAYTARTGGTLITDLQDASGVAISGGTIVPEQDGRLPRFLGPDDGTAALWMDFGAGRFLLLATDDDTRLTALESGGGVVASGVQYGATAIVYSNHFRTSRPATDAANFTWTCDGTSDQTEINAAITAVSGEPGGKVLLLGPLFNISGPIQLRTGVALQGEGLGTVVRAATDFQDGMVTLFDTSAHVTHLSMLTLDGDFNQVHGIKYVGGNIGDAGQIFESTPSSNPDPSHWIRDVHIISVGNNTYAGHGLWLFGGNLRAGKYSDMRILNAAGCGVWVDAAVDSHFTNIDVGSTGDDGLTVSSSTSAPVGHGFFIRQGDNCMFTACKSWFSNGAGYWVQGSRNGFANCQAQDNGGNGFHIFHGKNSFVGCHADSNGSDAAQGDAGFYLSTTNVTIDGCQSYDRNRGWQNYGIRYAGTNNYNMIDLLTYGNVTASTVGTPGTPNTIRIQADSGGK